MITEKDILNQGYKHISTCRDGGTKEYRYNNSYLILEYIGDNTLTPSNEFDNWPIAKLNNLFRQIGKNTYEQVIKPKNKNEVSPEQSYSATVKAFNG